MTLGLSTNNSKETQPVPSALSSLGSSQWRTLT